VFFRERRVAVTTPPSRERSADVAEPMAAPAAPAQAMPPSPVQERASAAAAGRDEYAATGMGRPTGHAVTQVQIEFETAPSQSTEIRYEFRPQLVKLGILPAAMPDDPLSRRERARGFQGDFAPVVPWRR
jgi:hypothetical protein